MKTDFFKMLMLLAIVAALGSCVVSKKKFIASEEGRFNAEEQVRLLTDIVNARNQKISELEATILGLEATIAGLRREVGGLASDTTRMGNQNREFQRIMTSQLSQQEQMNAMLRSQREAIAERERTINELNSIIQMQNDMVSSLLRQVTDALIGFGSDELTVQMRDGKVYVAMSDRLLFRSGSADVETRGRQALAMLAEVLANQPEIEIFIEGHTDNVPIRTARFTDNWDLSVLRATSMVRILTTDHNVNPTQIIPSGRSQYFPVDDNATTEGRARNRRTEVILAPRLDKLYQMLNEYQAK